MKPNTLAPPAEKAGTPEGRKNVLLKHAATLLRASRYALRKCSLNPEQDHAGYFDSVYKLLAVIEYYESARRAEPQPEAGEFTVLTSHEAANPDPLQRQLNNCYSPIDWPEHRHDENGGYINRCMFCEREFVGHKRQQGCRECSDSKMSMGFVSQPQPEATAGQTDEELTNYVSEARGVVLQGIRRSPNLPDYVKPLAIAIVGPLFSVLGQAIGGFELSVYRTEQHLQQSRAVRQEGKIKELGEKEA